VVLDKREAGWGSTSASTGLLQYEIDTNLYQLKEMVGEANAIRAYKLGVEAIDAIGQLVEEVGAKEDFKRRPSLYSARRRQDEQALEQEFAARQTAGLRVRLVQQRQLQEEFGVRARAAIVSEDAAQIDPYLMAHQLLAKSVKLGAQVYDRTEVKTINAKTSNTKTSKGKGVLLTTDRGVTVAAKKMVFASGYETQNYLKQKVAELNSTYALVSEPLAEAKQWAKHLLWEAARPYFYLRTTDDGRLIMGGADEPFRDPERRDRLIGRKTATLLKQYAAFYPGRPVPEVAFAWAGTFGETKDGLAYIGVSPEAPYAYFALGYGGNGITYSMIAARIITDLYSGIDNPDAKLFRFDR
jgi:glycine/D-amino acid oxidase-like deaminating enzyme